MSDEPSSRIFITDCKPVEWSRTWRWRNKCHLIVDTDSSLKSLHIFAQAVGMKRSWYQDRGTMPRYDLSDKHHAIAVHAGAIPIRGKNLAALYARWMREKGEPIPKDEAYLVEWEIPLSVMELATLSNKKANG